jgi:hypothetical protein
MDDTLFFKNLLEKHKDLVEMSTKKKYTFIVPLAKYITPNMLIRNFYDNHVFYQCDYDPKMYVNLNGRVLEFKNNQFQTFLGFKRQMTFNVIEELMREIMNNVYTKVIYIDNVIDETVYNQSSSVTSNLSKKDTMKRYNNKDDYVKYFGNLVRLNDELKEIEYNLKELIDKLQNNYILIKGHVHTYYKYYQELVSEFRTYLSSKLSKYKLDDAFNTIIHELTESLVFNKIYQFLFLNLKQFNVDEEAELKVKMNNLKNDFSFSIYKLDSVFNECKFRSAVAEIKKISSCSTPFEKFVRTYFFNSILNYKFLKFKNF